MSNRIGNAIFCQHPIEARHAADDLEGALARQATRATQDHALSIADATGVSGRAIDGLIDHLNQRSTGRPVDDRDTNIDDVPDEDPERFDGQS
jgi:hypothetical protein